MPFRRFMAMHKYAVIMQESEKLDSLDIAAVAICNADYYKSVANRFIATMRSVESQDTSPESIPTYTPSPKETAQIQDAMRHIFEQKRKLMGLHA